ncbi:MAG TPA: hypothetical protein VJ952_03365 [Opitutales bacterium]|nr:hypothetical protein [Opitutales bacterium]
MSSVSSDSEGDNVRLKQIADILDVYRVALEKVGVRLEESSIDESLDKCRRHHDEHIRCHQIEERSVDPLKIYAWFGFDLADKLTRKSQELLDGDDSCSSNAILAQRHDILKALVATMNSTILVERPRGGLDRVTLNYLVRLLERELDEDSDHGIGQNGIFAAFHSALSMKRAFYRIVRKGWEGSKESD